MVKLPIDVHELEQAFDNSSEEMEYYLDRQTGEILMFWGDNLPAPVDELPVVDDPDPAALEAAFAAWWEEQDAPDWQRAAAWDACRVQNDATGRYLLIPPADSRDDYQVMAAFAESLADGRFRARVQDALHGKGAFRRFKDTIAERPAEEQRWYAFRDAQRRDRMVEWLAEEGIEPEGWPEPGHPRP